jgi:hypothetical protein
MSLSAVLTACVFAAFLAAMVAWIDRWRETRLTVVRPVQRARVQLARVPVAPTARKRAA